MAKKKGKPISFDAMIKFFMQTYHIPTTRDVDRLMARIDRLEAALKSSKATGRKRKAGGTGKAAPRKDSLTAADTVLEVVRSYRKGAGFADIQLKTGFEDKKLRNIIYRLGKLEKIKSKSRGIYLAVK